MELTSDVDDFKGNQDTDPKEADLPQCCWEAYFMARNPAKEIIDIDQTRKMSDFSAL